MDRAAGCKRWTIPELGEAVDPGGRDGCDLAVAPGGDQAAGFDKGYECGRLEGQESGRQEVLAQAQRLGQLMHSLARPFEELDREVEEGLVALTLAIVRKLVHAEIKSSPQQIASVVNETLALLPGASRDVHLHLHPADAQLVGELLPDIAAGNMLQIVADGSLQQGGCLVKTRSSRIDATVEARLENVIASFLNVDTDGETTA